MYLSNTDILAAIKAGELIVKCGKGDQPIVCDTSIDLRLDSIETAKVWDTVKLAEHNRRHGHGPLEVKIARFDYSAVASEFTMQPVPEREDRHREAKVVRRDDAIIIRPSGFVLWQTKEIVGTPPVNAKHICFVDGKSKRARTGLVVHLTAPTIHGAWAGHITLEMCNLGPLDLVLYENDVVAQIVVAKLSSPPDPKLNAAPSSTQGQTDVTGSRRPE